jgi:hypothetical protein
MILSLRPTAGSAAVLRLNTTTPRPQNYGMVALPPLPAALDPATTLSHHPSPLPRVRAQRHAAPHTLTPTLNPPPPAPAAFGPATTPSNRPPLPSSVSAQRHFLPDPLTHSPTPPPPPTVPQPTNHASLRLPPPQPRPVPLVATDSPSWPRGASTRARGSPREVVPTPLAPPTAPRSDMAGRRAFAQQRGTAEHRRPHCRLCTRVLYNGARARGVFVT